MSITVRSLLAAMLAFVVFALGPAGPALGHDAGSGPAHHGAQAVDTEPGPAITKTWIVDNGRRPDKIRHLHLFPEADDATGSVADQSAGVTSGAAFTALPTAEDEPICVESGHRVVAVRVYKEGEAETANADSTIRTTLRRMNWKIRRQALLSSEGQSPRELKVECTSTGVIRVHRVRYESTPGHFRTPLGWAQESAYKALGRPEGCCPGFDFDGSKAVKYLVFADFEHASGGLTDLSSDKDKSASDDAVLKTTNANRIFSSAAAVSMQLAHTHVPMHELFHGMGSVLQISQYAGSGFHCIDGLDIMCLTGDGGDPNYFVRCNGYDAEGNAHSSPIGAPIDCGFDTYFDTKTEDSEPLSRFWNVGGLENPYLWHPDPDPEPDPQPAPPAPQADWDVRSISTGLTQSAVSCLPSPPTEIWWEQGPAQCTAVGFGRDGTGHIRALAWRWSGEQGATEWSEQSVAQPAGARSVRLEAVSCVDLSTCRAAGSQVTNGTRYPLLASWNGSGWTTTSAPLPPSASDAELFGISCGGTEACVAVGRYEILSGQYSVSMAMHWDGSQWSTAQLPIPAGTSADDRLRAISCVNGEECLAVGSYSHEGTPKGLAMAWNGASWTLLPVPSPAGASATRLTGVDCVAGGVCKAVGSYEEGGESKALALDWDGAEWSSPAAVPDAGEGPDELSGISCLGAASCRAVGTTTGAPLTMRWDGTEWSAEALSNEGGLTSVSCAASGAEECLSVGGTSFADGSEAPLAFLNAGSAWDDISLQVVERNLLRDVSCVAADRCMAVGEVSTVAGGETTLAQAWHGLAWEGMPMPSAGSSARLDAVSCSSITQCVAVGRSDSAPGGLVERLSEGSWSIASTQAPPSGSSGRLEGVSCSSATRCVAVGRYVHSTKGTKPLLQSWNGGAWTSYSLSEREGTVVQPEWGEYLADVSCLPSGACVAVGETQYDTPFVTHRVDGSWYYEVVPKPTDATGWAKLSAVSCTSSSSCFALGAYQVSAGTRGFMARWDGAKWSVQATTGLTFEDVSCLSADWCVAIDEQASGTPTSTATWNGSGWTIASDPFGLGAGDTPLVKGLSCAAGGCAAVGQQYPNDQDRAFAATLE